MEKTYDPQAIEQHWYQNWEAKGYFAPSGDGDPYCIMLPPPNVTGTLHMGHGFQHTIMDALIRYQRMCGRDTLWQPGTDHAGIATQMVVERLLLAEGTSRHDIGRDEFERRIWEWKHHSGSTITSQMRRIGDSVDWSRERFTMDEGLAHAVRTVFIKLHEEGLIYRGKRLVNWDPKLLTAVSDLEVISEEEEGSLWHIRYPLVDGSSYVVVATTRPETMLGDVAVAVNPNDERYQNLIGQMLCLPLTDRQIPVIADDYVDQEFGTGCVKITPAHDFNDYEVGQRHQLEPINILTPDAKINDQAPAKYQGLDRYQARAQMIQDLEDLDLIEKIEPHKLKVPRGDRSGAVIEPYLTNQWYVKVEPLAEPARKAVENGDIKFVPENWQNTYFQWMNNLQDWCISRQLWWGHRIPAWYDDAGNTYVGQDEDDVRMRHNLADDIKLHQDEDVLDTWFSAGLWPFSTLGWPEETPELKKYYPGSVLVTGFDIIFFWVARMIMFGLKFMGDVPFKTVYFTGLIRDAEGQKMSKSKGNVLDPVDLVDGIELEDLIAKRTKGLMQPAMAERIEKATRKDYPEGIAAYGVDALRFTFCALASTSRDICFDLGRVAGYRNFCNKIWNAARYVLMNTEDKDTGINSKDLQFGLAEQWIQSRLQQTIQKVHQYFADYRFDLMTQELHDFIWHHYCDWYLELSKPVLFDENADAALQRGTRYTLVTVLETAMRLLHPVMPFISEEIWQKIAPLTGVGGNSIMQQAFPEYDSQRVNSEAETELQWLQQVITAIRNIRGEMNIAPNKPIPALFTKGGEHDHSYVSKHRDFISKLAKLEQLEWLDDSATRPAAATGLVGDLEILIPLAGLIDKDAEQERLNKELSKLDKELKRVQGKLGNASFVDKAPAEVVTKERERCAELEATLTKIHSQLEHLAEL